MTLHKLLDRDVYRGGAIVVGPVRRGRGRRLRVERRIVPVTSDPERRLRVFERELWRIAVEYLSPGRAARLGGARRRARGGRTAGAARRRRSTTTPAASCAAASCSSCIQRNRNAQLRQRALAEIAARRDPEGFDEAVDIVGTLVARGAPRGRAHPAAGAGRAPHRPPRPGAGLAVAAGRVLARRARGVRGAALAGDQAPARAARQLLRARRTGATPAGSCTPRASTTAAWRPRCSPPRSRTRPRPRRCCAARATGWRASRRRSRASWCATSRRASAAARSSATAATALAPRGGERPTAPSRAAEAIDAPRPAS